MKELKSMKDLKIDLFPGEGEENKAGVRLVSTGESTLIDLRGDARVALRLLCEALALVGPSVRDGMSDEFEVWKRDAFRKVFEAVFGDINKVLRKTEAEIDALEKEIREEAKKNGIVIDADAII